MNTNMMVIISLMVFSQHALANGTSKNDRLKEQDNKFHNIKYETPLNTTIPQPLILVETDNFIFFPDCSTTTVSGDNKGALSLSLTAKIGEPFSFCSLSNNACTRTWDQELRYTNTVGNYRFFDTTSAGFFTDSIDTSRMNLMGYTENPTGSFNIKETDINTIFYTDRIIEFSRLYGKFSPDTQSCTFFIEYKIMHDDAWLTIE